MKLGVVRAKSSRYSMFKDVSEPKNAEDFLEYNFEHAPTMLVPGDWNGQDANLTWYDGMVWMRRHFEINELSNQRQLLHFGAVNYKALVYLNGKKVGEHEGGFTPFSFDVTDIVKSGKNTLVVSVDSHHDKQSLPSPSVDWKNYGGITRPVKLISVPDTYIHDYFVRLNKNNNIQTQVRLGGTTPKNQPVQLTIPELGISLRGKTDQKGHVSFNVNAGNKVQKWSPDTPKLYSVIIEAAGNKVSDNVGLRTISTSGDKILLNGESIFLRGISIHEESLGATPSRALNESRAREILSIAKYDLNANFVRLAHYPHTSMMTKIADELGLLVWSEIPVYWDIDFKNPKTLALAKKIQQENIIRDRNRASIMFWSIANETPQTDERLAFLTELTKDLRKLDNTRLVTAALHKVKKRGGAFNVGDPLGKLIDVVAVNTYEGWYGKMALKDVPDVKWNNPTGKPFMFSEFGAGALYGFRDTNLEKFSEDFQAEYYKATIAMAKQVPGLVGLSPWVLKDFQSPRRMHSRFQNHWNRKGLISPEGHKKAAFNVLEDWYKEIISKEGQ
jgi:beta-glucuronidase